MTAIFISMYNDKRTQTCILVELSSINISLCHVFFALCVTVLNDVDTLSPSADVRINLPKRQLFDFVFALTEFPKQESRDSIPTNKSSCLCAQVHLCVM